MNGQRPWFSESEECWSAVKGNEANMQRETVAGTVLGGSMFLVPVVPGVPSLPPCISCDWIIQPLLGFYLFKLGFISLSLG